MFTGIVETIGEVRAVAPNDGGRRLTVATDVAEELEPGQSVSVDGVCLTVESNDRETFEVFLSAETVDRSSLGARSTGDRVNLERALRADGRFDGHLVQGHVDTTVEITGIEPVGADWWFTFELPTGFERYVVEKGSIAVDGISLTVADRTATAFGISVIPATYEATTLADRSVGNIANVEVDILAKYVETMLENR